MDSNEGENSYSELLLCLYGYEGLCRSWRVAKTITKALLSMSLQKGAISGNSARRILQDTENSQLHNDSGEVRATFMGDLSLAASDPHAATVENLADRFEEHAFLSDCTHILDKEGPCN